MRRLPALLILVLLVAGCGPGRVAPDQAAVVDGVAIPMDTLNAQVKESTMMSPKTISMPEMA